MRTSEQTSTLRNFQEWVDQTTDARLTSSAMEMDAEVQFFFAESIDDIVRWTIAKADSLR